MMGWRSRITIIYLYGMHNYETILVLLRKLKRLNFSIELLLYLSLELLVQKYCIITCLLLFSCPYMLINVSVQCNGGLLPDIILLTLCDSIGEPF